MSRSTNSTVFKSASTGVLRPMRGLSAEDSDPLQAVLNHRWEQRPFTPSSKDGDLARRTGTRRSAASGKGKAFEEAGRSRLQHSANGMFVETKSRLFASAEAEDVLTTQDKSVHRRGLKGNSMDGVLPPRRTYTFDLCPATERSPRLRSPPPHRRGTAKLLFENSLEDAENEHQQAEVENHHSLVSKEEQEFVDLVHHLESIVSQAALRMNDLMLVVRRHFQDDKTWLEKRTNYDQLTEIAFELLTANYFLGKWHHQLEPRKFPAPPKPEKLEDMPAEDILAQTQGSISRMEILTSELTPILNRIIVDAKTLRKGPDGEPISPTSRNPVKLAAKRGFHDVGNLHHLGEHLEHLLAAAQHLAHPPTTGLEPHIRAVQVRNASSVVMAANRFKKAAKPNNEVDEKLDADTTSADSLTKAVGRIRGGVTSSTQASEEVVVDETTSKPQV